MMLGSMLSIISRARSELSLSLLVLLGGWANGMCRVLTDLGAKTRVMELMTHPDPNVRYQALVSVQRLVSHPWAA